MSIKNNVIAFAPWDVFFAFFLASFHIVGVTREEAKIDEWKTAMFYGGRWGGRGEMYPEWEFIREIHGFENYSEMCEEGRDKE